MLQPLSYASTPRRIVRWRQRFWRHRIAMCFGLAFLTGPCFMIWIFRALALLDPSLTMLRGSAPLIICLAAQAFMLLTWMAIAIGLMFDDRTLTDLEEVMMPLTLVIITCWTFVDVMALAVRGLDQMI
jgi:hypothetical protein